MMKLKWIFGIAVIALIYACAGKKDDLKPISGVDGSAVFKTHCQLCHGPDGKLGLNGAKDFSVSELTLEERVEVITKGRNTMASYENILSEDEIKAVAQYTLTFKE